MNSIGTTYITNLQRLNPAISIHHLKKDTDRKHASLQKYNLNENTDKSFNKIYIIPAKNVQLPTVDARKTSNKRLLD